MMSWVISGTGLRSSVRTAISFCFVEWLNHNRDLFTAYKASLGYIWALFSFKYRYNQSWRATFILFLCQQKSPYLLYQGKSFLAPAYRL